jgi:iron complex outermembrane receptor protein
VTLQGDYYGGETEETSLLLSQSENDIRGANAIAGWTHTISEDSDVQLRLWYDFTDRDGDLLAEDRDTFDAELQHRFSPFSRHDLVWGAGYRLTADEIDNSSGVIFDPQRRHRRAVQRLRAGRDHGRRRAARADARHEGRVQRLQPPRVAAQRALLLTPWERHSFWAAVSRAVRAPSRAENDVALLVPQATPPPNFSLLNGDHASRPRT